MSIPYTKVGSVEVQFRQVSLYIYYKTTNYIPDVGGELSTRIPSDCVSVQIFAPLQKISLKIKIPPSCKSKFVNVYSRTIPFTYKKIPTIS